jgi:hypothetical protein
MTKTSETPTDALPTIDVGNMVCDRSPQRDLREDTDDPSPYDGLDFPEAMIVIAIPNRRADDYTIEEICMTVSEANAGYPDDDPVIVTAYCRTLDHHVPRWAHKYIDTDDGESFVSWLTDYEDIWGITIPTYAFPRSRLEKTPMRSVLDADYPEVVDNE